MPGARRLSVAALLAFVLHHVSADRQDASNFFAEFDGLETALPSGGPEVRSALESVRLKNFGRKPPPSPESRRYSKPGLFPQLPKPEPGQITHNQQSIQEYAAYQEQPQDERIAESVEKFTGNLDNQGHRLSPNSSSQGKPQLLNGVLYYQEKPDIKELQSFRQRLVLGNPLTSQGKLHRGEITEIENKESVKNNGYISYDKERTNFRNTRVIPQSQEVVIQRSSEAFLADRESPSFLSKTAEYGQLHLGLQQNQPLQNSPNEANINIINNDKVSRSNQEEARPNMENPPRISAEAFLTDGGNQYLTQLQKFLPQEQKNRERPLSFSDNIHLANVGRNYQRNEEAIDGRNDQRNEEANDEKNHQKNYEVNDRRYKKKNEEATDVRNDMRNDKKNYQGKDEANNGRNHHTNERAIDGRIYRKNDMTYERRNYQKNNEANDGTNYWRNEQANDGRNHERNGDLNDGRNYQRKEETNERKDYHKNDEANDGRNYQRNDETNNRRNYQRNKDLNNGRNSQENQETNDERNYQRNEEAIADLSGRISEDTFLADQDDSYILPRKKSPFLEYEILGSRERQSARSSDRNLTNERKKEGDGDIERSSRLSAEIFLTDSDEKYLQRQKVLSQEKANPENHERTFSRSGDYELTNKNDINDRLRNDGRELVALERSSKGSPETFLTDTDDLFLDRGYILKLRSKSVNRPNLQANSPASRSAETFLTDEDDKNYFPPKQQSSRETTSSRSDETFLTDKEEFPGFRKPSNDDRPLPPRSSETFLTDEDDPPGLGSRRPMQPTRSPADRDNSSPRSEELFLSEDELPPKKESYRPVPSSEENSILDNDNFLTDRDPNPIPAPQSKIVPGRRPTPPSHLGRVRWPLPKSAESDESNAQEEHDFQPLFYGDMKATLPEYDSEKGRREQSRRNGYSINRDHRDSSEVQKDVGRTQMKKPEAFDEERPPIYDDHHPLLDFEESSEKTPTPLNNHRNPLTHSESNSERQDNREEEEEHEEEEDEHSSKESDETFPGDGDNESEEEDSPLNELDSEEALPPASANSGETHDEHDDHESVEAPSPDHSQEQSPLPPEHSREEEHGVHSHEEHPIPPPPQDQSNEELPSVNNVDSDETPEEGHRGESGRPLHSEEEAEEGQSEEENEEKPPPDYDERPPDYESIKPTPEYEDSGNHSEEEFTEAGVESSQEKSEEDYGGGHSEEEPDYSEGPKPPGEKGNRPSPDYEGHGSAQQSGEGGNENASPEFNFESFEFPDVMEPPPSRENDGPTTRRPPSSRRPTSLPDDCPDGDEATTRSPLNLSNAKRPISTVRPPVRHGDEVSITVSGPKAVKVRTTKGTTTTTTRPVTISALGVVKPGGEIIAKVVQPTSPTTSAPTTRQPSATLRSARLRPGIQFGAKVKTKQKAADSSGSPSTTAKPSEPWKALLAAREATALTYLKPPPVGQPQTWLHSSPPPTPMFKLFVV